MNCREMTDFLSAYLSGEMPPDERDRFEEHLKYCPPCVQYLDGYKKTIEVGRKCCEHEKAAVPEDLVQAILNSRRRE